MWIGDRLSSHEQIGEDKSQRKAYDEVTHKSDVQGIEDAS